ncbi:MAG: ketol-acid reductoisomerase [Pleomorphochaeta sp.]
MGKIYYDKDANIDIIKDKVVAIIGYGNQGRSQALNLRDSGVSKIIVGSRKDDSWNDANEDGFEVFSIEEATKKADILFLLIPDEVAPSIYSEKIAPNLVEGNVVNFSSGYNITFNHIIPAKNIDIIMVAPRMIGKGVRELYQNKEGFPSFVAVNQDASGNAWEITLALAKGIGSTKKGAIEVKFNDETYLDLMSEQAIWPLIYSVFTEAFKYQVSMGHPEEAVLMELYLSKEPAVMMEKAADVGFFKQMPYHSNTSQYGQLTGFAKADKSVIKNFIASQYEKIKSGEFANEWENEMNNNLAKFKEMQKDVFASEMNLAEERVKERL